MKSLLPDFTVGAVDVVAYAMKEELRDKMIKSVQELRKAGLSVDAVLDSRKPKWVFNRADKMGARKVLLFAEEEDKAGEATVKDMVSGEQQRCAYDQLVALLQK